MKNSSAAVASISGAALLALTGCMAAEGPDEAPHEMSHTLDDSAEWYLYEPTAYHDAQTWEADEDSPTYETSEERLEEISCGVASNHYQGAWYADVALGEYLPPDYTPEVLAFNVEDEDTPSGEPEMSVQISIPCETWVDAVEEEGINPDVLTRHLHLTEEAATSLMTQDELAGGVLELDSEAPDLRSEDVGAVYYRVVPDAEQ